VHGDSTLIVDLLRRGVAEAVVITSPRVSPERVERVAASVDPGCLRRLRVLIEEVSPRNLLVGENREPG
jgi:hypothetical protein